MITFSSTWALCLLPLPLLVYFFAPSVKSKKRSALVIPFFQELVGSGGSLQHDRSDRLPIFLASLAWLALVISSADPRWHGDAIPLPSKGRDLMMAVDLSASMDERDFSYQGRYIDRLTATKLVAGDFISKRKGDRLGLVLFADKAYTQTPLTFDTDTVRQLLDEAVLGLAGKKTAIGDAIALSVKKMIDASQEQKILILLTDGENTAGDIDPIKAAELAADEGLKIYTIGIGADPGSSIFSQLMPRSQLDEKTLRKIAQITGGQYFRANNVQELSKIYSLVDELEPIKQDVQFFRPVVSLYQWPLYFGAMFIGLLGFHLLVTNTVRRR